MKSVIALILAVAFAVAGTVVLTGCAADLSGITPVTEADMHEQLADAQALQDQALQEALEGDNVTAVGLYLLSVLSGIGGAVGLSKARRRNQAIGADALAAVTGIQQAIARPEIKKEDQAG